MTVVLSGVVAAIGVSRWPAYESTHPVTPRTVLIVALFVPLLVTRARRGPARLRHPARRPHPRARGVARPARGGGHRGAPLDRARPARRGPAAARHDRRQPRPGDPAVGPGPGAGAHHRARPAGPARGRDPRPARPGARHLPAASSASAAWSGPFRRRPAARSCRARSTCRAWAGTRPRSRRRSTSAAPRRSTTPTGTRGARSSRCRPPTTRDPAAGCGSASPTTVTASTRPAVRSTHGLTGMRDRIRAAGGELRIISAPGPWHHRRGALRSGHASAALTKTPSEPTESGRRID